MSVKLVQYHQNIAPTPNNIRVTLVLGLMQQQADMVRQWQQFHFCCVLYAGEATTKTACEGISILAMHSSVTAWENHCRKKEKNLRRIPKATDKATLENCYGYCCTKLGKSKNTLSRCEIWARRTEEASLKHSHIRMAFPQCYINVHVSQW